MHAGDNKNLSVGRKSLEPAATRLVLSAVKTDPHAFPDPSGRKLACDIKAEGEAENVQELNFTE